MTACPACLAAERNPLSGLFDLTNCRACRVRHTASLPRPLREAVYEALPADDLAQFVADVRAEFGRQRTAASEAAARRRVEEAWGPR